MERKGSMPDERCHAHTECVPDQCLQKVTLHLPVGFVHGLLVPAVADHFQVSGECLGEGEPGDTDGLTGNLDPWPVCHLFKGIV